MRRPDPDGRLCTFVRVCRRHADVDDRDVRFLVADRAFERFGATDLGHHLEALSARRRASRSSTESSAITTRMAAPPRRAFPGPGAPTTRRPPPCASTRSARPRSPVPFAGVGAADTVVRDLDHERGQDTALIVTARGGGVSPRSRARLAGDEVGGSLDLGRRPPGEHRRDGDRNRRPLRERVERGLVRPLSAPRGGRPPRASQLGDGLLQLADGALEHRLGVGVVSPRAASARPGARARGRMRRCCTVVEVALDAPALLVTGRHDSRPRLLDARELGLEPSACRRAFSSASRAAAPTASISPGCRAGLESWTSAPRLAVALERGHGTPGPVDRHVDRPPFRVRVAPSPGKPEGDLQGRVVHRLREGGAKLARRHPIGSRTRSLTCVCASRAPSTPARSAPGALVRPTNCHQKSASSVEGETSTNVDALGDGAEGRDHRREQQRRQHYARGRHARGAGRRAARRSRRGCRTQRPCTSCGGRRRASGSEGS